LGAADHSPTSTRKYPTGLAGWGCQSPRILTPQIRGKLPSPCEMLLQNNPSAARSPYNR